MLAREDRAIPQVSMTGGVIPVDVRDDDTLDVILVKVLITFLVLVEVWGSKDSGEELSNVGYSVDVALPILSLPRVASRAGDGHGRVIEPATDPDHASVAWVVGFHLTANPLPYPVRVVVDITIVCRCKLGIRGSPNCYWWRWRPLPLSASPSCCCGTKGDLDESLGSGGLQRATRRVLRELNGILNGLFRVRRPDSRFPLISYSAVPAASPPLAPR